MIEPLSTTISFQGRTFRQLRRSGNVAIYDIRNAANTLYGFEVIVIKTLPAEMICGKFYPERESYPSSSKNSNDWGTIAWSFPAKGRLQALAAFNGLVKRQTPSGGIATKSDLVKEEG
jgi:hypothetical protein